MVFEGSMIIVAVMALTIFPPGRVFDGLWRESGHGSKGVAAYSKNGAFVLDGNHEEFTRRDGKNGSRFREIAVVRDGGLDIWVSEQHWNERSCGPLRARCKCNI